MITLDYQQAIDSQLGLTQLNKLAEERKLSFALGIRLSRLIKVIEPEIQEFLKHRQELLNKYGVEIFDEAGQTTGRYELKDNIEVFNKELSDLLHDKIDITNFNKFKESELSELQLTVAEIISLDPFIESTETNI